MINTILDVITGRWHKRKLEEEKMEKARKRDEIHEHMMAMAKLSSYQQQPVPQNLIDRYERIRDEISSLKKVDRLNIFKKMPAHLRQRIVDQNAIYEAKNKMNNSVVGNSLTDEHYDLWNQIRALDRDHSVFFKDTDESCGGSDSVPEIVIPGTTFEDLLRAHVHATAEEELTGNQSESKD